MEDKKEQIQNANMLLGTGAGLAAFGAGTAALIGVTCPLCVVAAPVLIGAGIVGRIRAGKTNPDEEGSDGKAGTEGETSHGK